MFCWKDKCSVGFDYVKCSLLYDVFVPFALHMSVFGLDSPIGLLPAVPNSNIFWPGKNVKGDVLYSVFLGGLNLDDIIEFVPPFV